MLKKLIAREIRLVEAKNKSQQGIKERLQVHTQKLDTPIRNNIFSVI